MKITQEEIVDRQTVLHIELEDDDMEPHLDRAYRKVVQKATIPGFRKGKAPRTIVERYVGREGLVNEALDDLLPDMTERAIKTQQLQTAGTPSVELLELDPVTVKATVPLTPTVDIGAYRDIRVEETPVEVTEDDIQQRLRALQERDAPWEPVERPVKFGDLVTMDATGRIEDTFILTNDDEEYVVVEDSPIPFPGFASNLVGMEADTTREFDLDIPEDHADARLAGKEARFEVTVKGVKERRLPELDDEFAKGVGDGYETLAELRESIEKDLIREKEQDQTTQYREAALDKLVQGSVFEFPPLLIDHEIQHMVQRRNLFVDRIDVSMDDYLTYIGKTDDEMREEMRERVVERLSRSYALSNLAEKEGLEVCDREIDERIQELGHSREESEGGDANHGIDMVSEEARSSIRETLLVEKSMERLVSIAKGGPAESKSGEESPAECDDDSEEEGAADDAKS